VLDRCLPNKLRTKQRPHTLRFHVGLEQEDIPLLDKFAQLSSRLNPLHLLQSLLDRTPGMDQTLRSLELRQLDLPGILVDNTDVGVTLLPK
jgi:hypothetical protein